MIKNINFTEHSTLFSQFPDYAEHLVRICCYAYETFARQKLYPNLTPIDPPLYIIDEPLLFDAIQYMPDAGAIVYNDAVEKAGRPPTNYAIGYMYRHWFDHSIGVDMRYCLSHEYQNMQLNMKAAITAGVVDADEIVGLWMRMHSHPLKHAAMESGLAMFIMSGMESSHQLLVEHLGLGTVYSGLSNGVQNTLHAFLEERLLVANRIAKFPPTITISLRQPRKRFTS
jgi:hypothetical protein